MIPDMHCPYCGAGISIDSCDYDIEQDGEYQYDCEACGKTFVFTTTISIDYSPSKADCLNGSPHTYLFSICAPAEYSTMQCTMCGERRALTVEEKGRYLK